MVKVLVIGASGYIGEAVARAFARNGHETYGLIRNAEKASKLAREEVIPVIGHAHDYESWGATAEAVSVVVDVSVDRSNPHKHALHIIDNLTKLAKARKGGKLTVIFTSGWWVYMHNAGPNFTEDDAPKPPPFLSWRTDLEQSILQRTDFNGIVIRPGNVYGRSGSLFGSFFSPSPNITVYGDQSTTWSVVHVDDVAEAYVLAAEKRDIVGGNVFNISNKASESVAAIAAASVKAAGLDAKIEFKAPDEKEYLQVGLSVSGNAWSGKAEQLLGWKQKQLGVVDGIDRYFFAWKAYQD